MKHTLSTVSSPSLSTSSTFSPTLSDVQRMTRGSWRMTVFSARKVVGEASNCMVQ